MIWYDNTTSAKTNIYIHVYVYVYIQQQMQKHAQEINAAQL